jgi:transglutaminase-like putative cysteine protease
MAGGAEVGGSVAHSSRGSGLATAGWGILAMAALLALVDLAIETWWSGSSIRWWVSPAAVLFVALSVWVWKPGEAAARRWGSSGAAAWSWCGLFLLLAATAWMPGGQTTGVRVLLQPTATVLTVTTAAAVLLAAVVLFRSLSMLPPTARLAARAALAALALYALASLGLALYERAPFAALFQGGAAWQRLPRWLQGAFVGAFAILPLALVGQVVRVADRLRRKQPVRVLLYQATALVMSIVMAASGVVPTTAGGAAPAAVPPVTGTRTSLPEGSAPAEAAPVVSFEQWQQKSPFAQGDAQKTWEQFSSAARAELARPGTDPSDIDAAAAALGRNAENIFAFLRDRVTLEPYSGMLRGARGTLAAGAGNALDRALLAQALLKASGTDSRLVTGMLAVEQADTLLGRYMAADTVSPALASAVYQPDDASVKTAVEDLSLKTGLEADRIDKVLRRATARTQAFWRAADEQRATQLGWLSDQIRQIGMPAATDGAALTAKLRERLKDHYWVQTREADGTWRDFDPSFADAAPGTAYASKPTPIARVPADKSHRFEFQLVYRTKAGNAVKQERLLTGSVASADALFAPVEFRIQPGEAVPETAALVSMDTASKIDMLRKLKRFQGLLRMGSQVVAGRVFDLEGHTYDAPGGNPMASPGGLMGGMLGFGAEASGPGAFLDVQVVLRLTGPGRPPMTQTRTLVRATDLQSPSFAPPVMEWEILLQPQWISADLASFQMLTQLLLVQQAIVDTLKGGPSGKTTQPPPPFPQQLMQLALLRQSATAGILREQAGLHALVDQPLLTIAGHRLAAIRPQEQRLVVERTVDIVENAVRFVAKGDGPPAAAFDAAIRQGVADSTLEHRLLQEAFPDTRAESGATILQRAQREQRPVRFAGSREADKLRGAGLAESDVEWVRAYEAPDARLAVATDSTGAAAWWSVRPDGNAVLRVSGGQGQGHTEHEEVVFINTLKILFSFACGLEVAKSSMHGPSSMAGWKIAFCAAAGGTSLGFVMGGIPHVYSFVLIGLEITEMIGSGIAESLEAQRK